MTMKNGAHSARAGAVCLLAAALLGGASAAALDPRPEAVGVEVDLLPTVASAFDGEPGGALQLWAGSGRDRLRLVGARLHYPNSLTQSLFRDRRNSTVAFLYDRFFHDGFRGPWVAVGAEYWWSSIGLRGGTERGQWSVPVATVGAGWIFPVWRGLYLNPWAGAHAPLSTRSVAVGAERYGPRPVEAEVSLKVGWAFPLGR